MPRPRNGNFPYVAHMGLAGPEDQGPIMLAKAAIALGFTKSVVIVIAINAFQYKNILIPGK